MKTPQDVGKYRLGIIRRLLAGELTTDQPERRALLPGPMEGFVGRFARGGKMSKINIDKMVDRFLGWRLPDDFAPDGSISFNHAPDAMGHEPTWPTGTNLLTAVQAKQMFSEVVQPDEEMLELMEGTANSVCARHNARNNGRL